MKSYRRGLFTLFCLLFTMTTGWVILGQDPSKEKPQPNTDVEIVVEGVAVPPPPGPGGEDHMTFNQEVITEKAGEGTIGWVANEMSFEGKPVKGAPYSAEAVTETVQTFSDGNRIQRKSSSSVYRDSEGRTRREQTLAAIGPWAAAGDSPQVIFINDPVTGVHYILNQREHIARKLPSPSFGGKLEVSAAPIDSETTRPGKRMKFLRTVDAERASGPALPLAGVYTPFSSKPQTEPLGKRVIEGLQAEGTRSTVTIPAGQIGNELPIQIISERWYSPELQAVIISKHSDPRMGETTYHLTNVNRSEQPHSLFEVPSDYTIKEGEPFVYQFQKHKPAESEK